MITSAAELESLVAELGFLPFFKNEIAGFSVEEHTPARLWFAEDADGPWEWKGPVASGGRCVYGKLFRSRAGFVSLDWFPDLANYRRDGYDFEGRYDDGLVPRRDKLVYDALAESRSLLSKSLKAKCGYGRNGLKGFDAVITRLQMQTFVNVENFEYMRDKSGAPYGWGVARYTTPEAQFGEAVLSLADARTPEQSRALILAHLSKLFPGAGEEKLERLIRG